MTTQPEMKKITVRDIKRDDVFEMGGNLYQVDYVNIVRNLVDVKSHILAQVGSPRLVDQTLYFVLDPMTPMLIEA